MCVEIGIHNNLMYMHTMTNRNNSNIVRDTLLDIYTSYLESEEFHFYFQ